MSLNDDALDGLDSSLVVDDDVVKLPAGAAHGQSKIIINVNTDDRTEDTKLSDEELQKLPMMNVAFKTVTDGVQKVMELEDVEQTITAQESISRSDVEMASGVFLSLLSGHVSINEFTHTPTKTNFAFAQRHMERHIAIEQASVVANFQLFIDQPLIDCQAILERLVGFYLPSVTQAVYEIGATARKVKEHLATGKDFVVPYNLTFINLSKIDLLGPDALKVKVPTINRADQAKLFENLQGLFKSTSLKAFVLGCNDGLPLETIFSPGTRATYMNSPVGIRDIAAFYASELPVDYLVDLVSKAKAQIDTVLAMQTESDKHKENYANISKFIIENTDKLQEMLKVVNDVTHLTQYLGLLGLLMGELLETYEKM